MHITNNYTIIDGLRFDTFFRPFDFFWILNIKTNEFESTGLLKKFFISWNVDKKNWFSTSVDIEKLSSKHCALTFKNMHITYDLWHGKTIFVKHYPYMELIEPLKVHINLDKRILIYSNNSYWKETDTTASIVLDCSVVSATLILIFCLETWYLKN